MLGKYRIERHIAGGGFADVYRAFDTIEGIHVALKVPRLREATKEELDDFRKEVRLNSRLNHPNILPIKNADFITDIFVIVYPLGGRTLEERLKTRLSVKTALEYSEQILDAVAHAHEHRVIHCDIKPANLVFFDDGRLLRLTDFGIGRLGVRTMIQGSGSGTVGYLAPEQAMGKLSFRSDVFSTGLVLYRMLAGRLPEWPFEWPPPGHLNLRRRVPAEMIALLRRSIEIDARRRFANGRVMRDAFVRLKARTLKHGARRRRRRALVRPVKDWQEVRVREFKRRYGRVLQTRFECERCGDPVSEAMQVCPWCGKERKRHRADTRFPATCPRCHRGVKLDWKFCPWCYGPGVGPLSDQEYSDRHYDGRCANPGCSRKVLMPFMRYCPWCHRKVRRAWKFQGATRTCHSCGWGVPGNYWDHCAWCGTSLRD